MTLFRAFLNDLSVEAFPSVESLREPFTALIVARQSSPNLMRAFFCTKRTTAVQGLGGMQLIAAIQNLPREERSAILQWLGRRGPFTDDDETEVPDNLYYFATYDVTERGLGEAARQLQMSNSSLSFSLLHRQDLDFSPETLNVVHGLLEQPLGAVDVPNTTDINKLVAAADAAVPEPQNWRELIQFCRDRFDRLLVGSHCEDVLRSQPFFPTAARRTIELLNVLNDLMSEIDGQGALTNRGEQLKQTYFVGKKAWFTDEAPGNQRDFGSEMTFPDPSDLTQKIQCFWHGKIKTPQFRVHFQWPVVPGTDRLKVVYIGPKISKR